MPRNTGGRRRFARNEAEEKQRPRSAAENNIELNPEADVKKKKKGRASGSMIPKLLLGLMVLFLLAAAVGIYFNQESQRRYQSENPPERTGAARFRESPQD